MLVYECIQYVFTCCTENIGFSRTGDNRWITQYEALFCVLNSKGQVMTWRLTRGLSFSEIEADLQSLKYRLLAQGKTLKVFYIDNCCSWRKKAKGSVCGSASCLPRHISCCEKIC